MSFKSAQWQYENMEPPEDPPDFVDTRTGKYYYGAGGDEDEVILKSWDDHHTIYVRREDFDEYYEPG